MSSGFKNSFHQAVAVSALGLFAVGVPGASAADLGGNCCADLEERIAELEATTARKGNRKVSLTVTGWVNEALFFWDDGVESNVYVGTNSLEQTRVQFKGEAKIAPDWAAGYRLELGLNPNALSGVSQTADDATGNPVIVRQSNWYISSKTYGRVTLGLTGTATYHLLDDADITQTRNFSDYEAAGVAFPNFFLRSNGASLGNNIRWSGVLRGTNNNSPGQNGRRNVVRYDTPELAGFVATVSWGEDDQFGVALSYKQTFGDFKVVGKAGYESDTDETTNPCSSDANRTVGGVVVPLHCNWFGVGGTIMHEPTGLYVYGAYGQQNDNSERAVQPLADGTDRAWYIQGGIEQEWFKIGKTTLFGEYRQDNAGSNLSANFNAAGGTGGATGGFVRSSDLSFYAAGIVQAIAGESVQMYAIYRHGDGDTTNSVGVTRRIDDFDSVIFGSKVTF